MRHLWEDETLASTTADQQHFNPGHPIPGRIHSDGYAPAGKSQRRPGVKLLCSKAGPCRMVSGSCSPPSTDTKWLMPDRPHEMLDILFSRGMVAHKAGKSKLLPSKQPLPINAVSLKVSAHSRLFRGRHGFAGQHRTQRAESPLT